MDITKVDFEPILEKAKESEVGLAELLNIIQPYVMYRASLQLSNKQDIEDIFQVVSVRIYNNLNKIAPKGFMSYLQTTITNACIDVIRKKGYVDKDEEEKSEEDKKESIKYISIDAYEDWQIEDKYNTPIDLTVEYRKEVVKQVLNSLPQEQRDVILLRYMDGLKTKDIALKLDTNENTIKSRLKAAHEKIEKEILAIQKRDDIKLYSYSPVLFFLLLLVRTNDYGIPNDLLTTQTVENITRNNIVDTVSKNVIDESAKTISDNVIKTQAANNTITATTDTIAKTAVASTAAKATTSIATKALVGLLVLGAVGGTAGFVIHNNKQKQMEELYNNDKVNITFDYGDSEALKVGESKTLTYEITSENDLEYQVSFEDKNPEVVSLEGNTLTALNIGEATIHAIITNKYTDKNMIEGFKVVVQVDNQLTAKANRMKEAGYTHFIYFDPLTSEDIFQSYDLFDWSKLNMTSEDYLQIEIYDPKTAENITNEKLSGLLRNTYAYDKYMMFKNFVVPDFARSGYNVWYRYDFIDNDINKIKLTAYGQGHEEYVVNLTYNSQYDKYEYISRDNETHYVDFDSLILPVSYTEGLGDWYFGRKINVEYDENKNIIKLSAGEPINDHYLGDFEVDIIRDEEGKIIRSEARNTDPVYGGYLGKEEFIYDEYGLLKNHIITGYNRFRNREEVVGLWIYEYK